MLPMTKSDGSPDISQVKPGMAFFCGTGPFGKTCGDCVHRGYSREARTGRWDDKLQSVIYRARRHFGCALFKKMTGRHGAVVETEFPSCKYFEQKPKA